MKRKTSKQKSTEGVRYFALHEAGLRNGSFYRVRRPGHCAQYINGDFMGNVGELPIRTPFPLKEFPREQAEKLIPKCCGT